MLFLPFDPLLRAMNESKLMAGLAMLLTNIGSRYMVADLGKIHEVILSSAIVKPLIIFCLFFTATRDASTSFLLMLAYVLIVQGFLHEDRPICLVPKNAYRSSKAPTEPEYARALEVVRSFENKKLS